MQIARVLVAVAAVMGGSVASAVAQGCGTPLEGDPITWKRSPELNAKAVRWFNALRAGECSEVGQADSRPSPNNPMGARESLYRVPGVTAEGLRKGRIVMRLNRRRFGQFIDYLYVWDRPASEGGPRWRWLRVTGSNSWEPRVIDSTRAFLCRKHDPGLPQDIVALFVSRERPRDCTIADAVYIEDAERRRARIDSMVGGRKGKPSYLATLRMLQAVRTSASRELLTVLAQDDGVWGRCGDDCCRAPIDQ